MTTMVSTSLTEEGNSAMAPRPELRGGLYGLLAAALFGASAPLSKVFLAETSPLALAGLLYLGAGLGLSIYRVVAPKAASSEREAGLQRADALPLLGIIVTGGILGPVLLLTGLERVSGLAGSLLLNLEAPFTIFVALLLFGEHLGRRAAVGAAFIVAGGLLLSYRPGAVHADLIGVLCIAAACLSWGLDNNLTQRLTLRSPVVVVWIKTLGAGGCTLGLALALGHELPPPGGVAGALALGSASYGASILLDMYALRILGAAREAAYFATAPFLGTLLAVPLLGESLTEADLAAGLLMAAGVVALVRERHRHLHGHEPLEHENIHVHDDHHRHEHEGSVSEPHSHPHRHEPLTHDHPHVPDLHHRHDHDHD